MEFTNQVVIVTGAAAERSIGRTTANLFAQKGATVIVADMDYEKAQESVAEIEAAGGCAFPIKVNVTNEEEVNHMVQTTLKKFGRIDVLFNNAGITQPVTLLDTNLEDWNRIIEVNLTGTFLVTKAVLPSMIKNQYGRIINMSSVSGKRGGGVYGGAHYSAAKAGVLGFSKAVAREIMTDGITINSVAPGAIATDIRREFTQEQERATWEAIPMKRPGTAAEVGNAVLFLASKEAAYITGEDIDINGGVHLD